MVADTKKQLTTLNQCDNELGKIYHNYAASYELSDTAFWLLYSIWDMGEGCTQRDICEKWFFKRQSINSAIKNLEAKGYLVLEDAHDNRKLKRIMLTETGRTFTKKVMEPIIDAEIASFQVFSEKERCMLIELTQKRTDLLRNKIIGIVQSK